MSEEVKPLIAKHNQDSVVDKRYCLQSAIAYLGEAKKLTAGDGMRAKVELARAWMELSNYIDEEGYILEC